jgi:hypothetical protein
MKLKDLFFLVSILLSASACVMPVQRPQPLSLPPSKIEYFEFSFLPPNEPGWYLARRSNNALELAREGKALDESYAIQIWLSELPDFESDQQFMSFIKHAMTGNPDGPRFKIIKTDASFVEREGQKCVKFLYMSEDRAATKRSDSNAPMILEVINRICRHPSNPNIGVYFIYSNRYYTGNSDSNLDDRASELFKNLEFNNP